MECSCVVIAWADTDDRCYASWSQVYSRLHNPHFSIKDPTFCVDISLCLKFTILTPSSGLHNPQFSFKDLAFRVDISLCHKSTIPTPLEQTNFKLPSWHWQYAEHTDATLRDPKSTLVSTIHILCWHQSLPQAHPPNSIRPSSPYQLHYRNQTIHFVIPSLLSSPQSAFLNQGPRISCWHQSLSQVHQQQQSLAN